MYITGGEILSTGNHTIYSNGNLNMTDGSVYAYQGGGIYTVGTGNTVVSGGTITKANYPIYIAFGSDNTNINITGGTITATAETAINNSGTGANVIIGTVGATDNTYPSITGRIYAASNTTGDITVNSGTITGTTSQAINSAGNIIINGGVISATSSYAVYSYNNASAILTINGGNITSTNNSYTITSSNATGAIFNITGGTITKNGTGAGAAINNWLGTTTITGGIIQNNTGYGVYATTGSVTIGTNDGGTPSTITPSITGKNYGVVKNSDSINFYDGVIIGQNGSGSSIYGTVVTPTGYSIKVTLSGTTETSILGK